MAWYGATARHGLRTLETEPARPLRHEWRRAILSVDEARPRYSARPRARRFHARWRCGPFRGRLADDLHQLSRPAGDAGQSGRRLFELLDAHSQLFGPRR